MQRHRLSSPTTKFNRLFTPVLAISTIIVSIVAISVNFGEDIFSDILFIVISSIVVIFALLYRKIRVIEYDKTNFYLKELFGENEEAVPLNKITAVKLSFRLAGIYSIETGTGVQYQFIPGVTVKKWPGGKAKKTPNIEHFFKNLEDLYEKEKLAKQAKEN